MEGFMAELLLYRGGMQIMCTSIKKLYHYSVQWLTFKSPSILWMRNFKMLMYSTIWCWLSEFTQCVARTDESHIFLNFQLPTVHGGVSIVRHLLSHLQGRESVIQNHSWCLPRIVNVTTSGSLFQYWLDAGATVMHYVFQYCTRTVMLRYEARA